MAVQDLFFNSPAILNILRTLNGQLGTDSSAYGEEFRTTTGSRKGSRPFVIGFIPPDVDVNFTAIKKDAGLFLKGASLPKSQTPTGNPKTKKGVVGDLKANVEALSDKFWSDYVDMCKRLKCKPEDLVAVLLFESGMDPSAGVGVAKGLNQIIEPVAKNQLGMSNDEWQQYGKYSGEQQLPWVEKYFGLFGKGGWANSTHLYAANIGGNAVAHYKEPGYVIYNGHFDKRGPDGSIPKKGTPEYAALGANASQITQEMANYDGNKGMDKEKRGKLTVSDIEAAANSRKGTAAYQLAVQKINEAKAGRSTRQVNPLEPSTGPSNVLNGIMKGANGLTDEEEDDPMKQIGRHISIDIDRQKLFVEKQIAEIKEQIFQIQNTPNLILLINPTSFGRHYEHNVDYTKGRRRPIVSMWHEKPLVISGKGVTAGQYVMKASGDGGLSNANRINSVSYENLMSLVYMYKNNGMIHTSGLGEETNRGVPLIPISLFIYYDGKIYIGSFDNFNVTDNVDKPYRLEYSFIFNCRYEVTVTSVAESVISGALWQELQLGEVIGNQIGDHMSLLLQMFMLPYRVKPL